MFENENPREEELDTPEDETPKVRQPPTRRPEYANRVPQWEVRQTVFEDDDD